VRKLIFGRRFQCRDDIRLSFVTLLMVTFVLSACGSAPKRTAPSGQNKPVASAAANKSAVALPDLPKANSGQGGYYQDDGPGENPSIDVESLVDPIPVVEAFSSSGNKPYKIRGKSYTPITDNTTAFKQRGLASWYGKKFHGRKTSSGELYDMYKLSAAHPTLPIPSYARVTNLENGKQVIVRINDRGPFHAGRVIDLSYSAAFKLDYLRKGSSLMEVERLLPADIEKMAENRQNQPAPSAPVLENNAVGEVAIPAPLAAQRESKPDQISIEDLIASHESKPIEKLSPGQDMPSQAPLFYIQFGAYAIRANAEATLSRLKTKLDKRLPDFDIVQQGNLYRLISGPFNTRAEATLIVVQNGDFGGFKALVVQR
jgi:rare lipoprotein A